jgi:histidyl-tRNA synthetase
MALVEHFREAEDALSEDSRERLHKNPLRILDSKDPRDQALVHDAPRIDDFLSGEAERYFVAVCDGLDAADVAWHREPTLVRGLDYYRHTAFEFVTDRLGAQGTVLGGGRYDGLIETLGGEHTPAVGWAAGIERLAMLVGATSERRPEAAIIPLGEAAELKAIGLAAELRRAALVVDLAFRGNMKKRMQRANAEGARYAIILGDAELAKGKAAVKNLRSGEQVDVGFEQLIEWIRAELTGEHRSPST